MNSKATEGKAVDHEHLPCCHCCVRCHPPLNVEEGKCAICPVFGRVCTYGLAPDEDHMILSRTSNVHGKANPETRSNSSQKQQPARDPQYFRPGSEHRLNRSVVHSVGGHQLYVPMIPLVHMIPVHSLQGSQVYMQVPFASMMAPKLAQSTMMPTEAVLVSDQQLPQNPESPEKKTKLKLSLVTTRRTLNESPMKKISSSKDLEDS